MIETWVPIKGYEDKYAISSFGNVKSIGRYVTKCIKGTTADYYLNERPLKSGINAVGYYYVVLYEDNLGKGVAVHKLVATHFIANPDKKEQVNHKDGNKLNNQVNNLEWCTRSENMKHAYANNLIKKRRRKPIINNKN